MSTIGNTDPDLIRIARAILCGRRGDGRWLVKSSDRAMELAEPVVDLLPDLLAEAERRGAVKALRQFRDSFDSFDQDHDNAIVAAIADERADAIENGADL